MQATAVRRAAAGVALFTVPASVALAVGWWGFAAVPLSIDEAVTAGVATRSPAGILRMLHQVDAVHGAYYLFMHYWVSAFGGTEVSLRMPSLIGTATAAGLLALLGRTLSTWRAGLVAGILFGCAPAASAYAQDARPYGISFALIVGATFALTGALTRSKINFGVYAVLVLLAVATHIFALLILPAHAIVVGVQSRRARTWRPVLWWTGACLVATLPLIGLGRLVVAQRGTAGWIARPGWPAVRDAIVALSGGTYLVAGAVVLTAFAYRRRTGDAATRTPDAFEVGWPWLLIPPVILVAVSIVTPLYAFRYVAFAVPALALLAGSTLDRLRWWLLVPVAAVLIGAAIPAQHAVRYQPAGAAGVDDLRADAAFLAVNERPGDGVIYLGPGQRYLSLAYPEPYRTLVDITVVRTPAEAANLAGTDLPDNALGPRLTQVNRAWTVKYFIWPGSRIAYKRREQAIFAALHNAGFHWVSTTRFRGSAIALWSRIR